MDDSTTEGRAWFAGLDRGDLDAARRALERGSADQPSGWPDLAVETGFATDAEDYYDALHEATVHATRAAVRERERADDRQLIHAVRAMDDCERVANELAERVADWGASLGEPGSDVANARTLAEAADDERLAGLAARVRDLEDEAAALRARVEQLAPTVAPNLAELAGPVLAARLIALAGGLEDLAKKPSGTVQVLGAEEALFAHLRGQAPSPKHGVIHVHEDLRTAPDGERGSAARVLAGKLSIAARIDHYSGDRRADLHEEYERRMARVHARGGDS